MDKEKTIDELRAENELLSHQLKEINEKVKSLGELLMDSKEKNVKLMYATRLFAEMHLTQDEKIAIAHEIDKALNAEQVERIYQKHIGHVDITDEDYQSDFIWSHGFIRDLEKYYFHHKGYNPFENISGSIKVIRKQFIIEDELKATSDPDKISMLRDAWKTNREASIIAVDEILAITNEILKK